MPGERESGPARGRRSRHGRRHPRASDRPRRLDQGHRRGEPQPHRRQRLAELAACLAAATPCDMA